MTWKVPEKFRITNDPKFYTKRGENYGAFRCISPDISRVTKTFLYIIASPGFDDIEVSKDWEHVSIRALKSIGANKTKDLTPTWIEMCYVKSLFWDEQDVVIQYHPAKKDYVNMHKNVLHLWRYKKAEFPQPPKILVGF